MSGRLESNIKEEAIFYAVDPSSGMDGKPL